jgi:hypothetical protein
MPTMGQQDNVSEWGRAHAIARQIRIVSNLLLHTLWDARKQILF